MHRRDFLLGSLAAFASYALLAELAPFAAPLSRRLTATRWIARQDELARALSSGTLSQIAWHDEIAVLARDVDVGQLMNEVGRARVSDAGAPFGHDPQKRNVRFLDDTGAPRTLTYGAALFVFHTGNVITPHAHKHMASAHMVVEGKVRIRTFDRVADDGTALIVRPTGDRIADIGEAAAMTSARDNAHWFVAASDRAMTFDVIIDSLDPGAESYLIQPFDPLGGEHLADGTIRAPLLSFDESMKRYDATL